MKAPDKIYIQPDAHDGWWNGDAPTEKYVEYIRKDALMEWAKSLRDDKLVPVISMNKLIEKFQSL